jgi:hypothetical protein
VIIELKAHITDDGKILLETPSKLPPGEVNIVITYVTDQEKHDELLWDAQFEATPTAAFEKLIAEGLEDYRTGQTDEFDPAQEDD